MHSIGKCTSGAHEPALRFTWLPTPFPQSVPFPRSPSSDSSNPAVHPRFVDWRRQQRRHHCRRSDRDGSKNRFVSPGRSGTVRDLEWRSIGVRPSKKRRESGVKAVRLPGRGSRETYFFKKNSRSLLLISLVFLVSPKLLF